MNGIVPFIEAFKRWLSGLTPYWKRLALFSAGGGVLFLVLITNQAGPGVEPAPGSLPPEVQAQAAALRAEHTGTLASLAQAPRYTLEAWVSPLDGNLEGQAQVLYTHRSNISTQELVFRLLPNAGSIYGGGSLEVHSATLADQALTIQLNEDGTVLRVQLPQALENGDSVEVSLAFDAQAPDHFGEGYGIFAQARSVLTLAGWYPILAAYPDAWEIPPVPAVGDALLAETSFYAVTLHLPPGYQVASTGTVVGQEDSPQGTLLRLVSGPAREFALAVSADFSVLEKEVGGVRLRLFTLPDRQGALSADEAMGLLEEGFSAFSELYGPYPYTELDVVETMITIGGYEFTGMVVVDDELRTQSRRADYNYILVHEVAHQWWYGLAGNHTVAEPWLDEAFATYSAVLAYEQTRGPGAGDGLLAHWRSSAGERSPGEPPVSSSAGEFTSWTAYRDTVYTRGALFLHDLRGEMGDEAFFQLLRAYQDEHRFDLADSQDFFDLAEVIHGQPLTGVIEKWFK